MTIQQESLSENEIKRVAKAYFKDYESLLHGFAIDCITVRLRKSTMTIMDFGLDGSFKEADFFLPTSGPDLLKKLIHYCGREKVESQLRNTVSFI